IADPFQVEVPAVIQPYIVHHKAGLDMPPGLLEAEAGDAGGPIAFRRVESRRVRDAGDGVEVWRRKGGGPTRGGRRRIIAAEVVEGAGRAGEFAPRHFGRERDRDAVGTR